MEQVAFENGRSRTAPPLWSGTVKSTTKFFRALHVSAAGDPCARSCIDATVSHPFALNAGLRIVPRDRRKSPVRITRLLAVLDALAEAAVARLKELDRLVLAKVQMQRRLRAKRKSSSLPALIDLVLSRPVVSAGLIAAELKVSQRAALDLVAALGIREVTGRGRYRAWGLV